MSALRKHADEALDRTWPGSAPARRPLESASPDRTDADSRLFEDLFRVGERLLEALNAEERLNRLLAKNPQDAAVMAQLLDCRRRTKPVEREYWELTVRIQALAGSTPPPGLRTSTSKSATLIWRIEAWVRSLLAPLVQ